MTSKYNFADIAEVDKHIAILLQCKPLPESEVKELTEKVQSFIQFVGKRNPS